MIVSINPATGEELARFEPDAPEAVDAALTAAVTAQSGWRERPLTDRVAVLRNMATVLRSRREAWARLIALEMGKPIGEALAEIEKCAWTCEVYAESAPAQLAEQSAPSNATYSKIVFEPLGVVLAIMPWNYPFWQVIRFAAPALAAGNGAVLKHAANVTQCALALRELFAEAGCPEGLVEVVLVEPEAVAGIIADDRIAAVTLTGSTQVGALVASQAGRALKKQVLELGGSDPFLVLADADIEAAATAAVKARFVNAGQSCVNAKRFIVVESVADEFVRAFTRNLGKLRMGDPLDAATDLGPLARASLRNELHRQVEASVAAGATLLAGGGVPEGRGCFYPATLLDHVRPGMPAFDEETFGPVAAVIRAATEDEAIELANRTTYGLAAAVWTRDLARGADLTRRIEAGAVFVNGVTASDPRLPFGGVKRSGYGRELGEFGIREFVNVKTVWFGPARPETPLQPVVRRPSEIAPHERGGGARTLPLVNATIGARRTLSGITEFDPDAAIPLHFHNCEETVMVLEGNAIVEIAGEEHAVGPLDTTWIPAGVHHRFRNASSSAPLRIYWTYASIDANRTIVATGKVTRIDEEHGLGPLG
jgi:succinate-semialdehyde dehydrogenase/glutarate-semialdehyde dehydrogenase